MTDLASRFLFNDLQVRAVAVRLSQTYHDVVCRGDYGPTVRPLLGQALAAAALMSQHLKLDGKLSLQLQSPGPLRLLFAEAQGKTLRGIARVDPEAVDVALPSRDRGAVLAINILPTGGERYQGLTSVDSDRLDVCCQQYFEQSEQIPTQLKLAADDGVAAGLLLQCLPSNSPTREQDWERLCMLLSTLGDEELLETPSVLLMQRLFAEESLILLGEEGLSFACSCSRVRVLATLAALPADDAAVGVGPMQTVTVHCEFCNERYDIDAAELDAYIHDAQAT